MKHIGWPIKNYLENPVDLEVSEGPFIIYKGRYRREIGWVKEIF